MRDIVILAVTASFFALCVAYVRWCDSIIGPDPDLADEEFDTAARGLDGATDVAPDAEVVRS